MCLKLVSLQRALLLTREKIEQSVDPKHVQKKLSHPYVTLFDPNVAQCVENKDNVSPRCNKAKQNVNTTTSALFTNNISLNIKILHLRELGFV